MLPTSCRSLSNRFAARNGAGTDWAIPPVGKKKLLMGAIKQSRPTLRRDFMEFSSLALSFRAGWFD